MVRRIAFVTAALAANLAAAQGADDLHHGMQGMDHAAHMAAMARAQRQAQVAGRGKDVMPFDLSATLHVFTKTADGGVQKVVARPGADAQQVRLVREHLKDIEAQFRAGDFSGPAHIHGTDMPGLAQLSSAGAGQVRVGYRDVPGGAELVFASEDPKLVEELHRWFDAQVADHGKDAVAGNPRR